MKDEEKISLINRITTGILYLEIKGKLYKLCQPTKDKKALSEYIYQKTLNDTKYSSLLTREEVKNLLLIRNIWTQADDEQYESFSKLLEETKIELYKNRYQPTKLKTIRNRIKSIRRGLEKGINKKYSMDYMTLEYHAEHVRESFLISLCIKDTYNNDIYDVHNYHDKDDFICKRFLNHLNLNILSTETFRELARTEPFRGTWSIGKNNVFGVDACELSNDQKTLIMYSKMYDNVYEHPERPDDEVIEDDDMLDGWFAEERKKSEKERKKKNIEDNYGGKFDKQGHNNELYIFSNPEDSNKIYELNDLQSRVKIRGRQKLISQQEKTREIQFSDIQTDLRQESIKNREGK